MGTLMPVFGFGMFNSGDGLVVVVGLMGLVDVDDVGDTGGDVREDEVAAYRGR
jgi:hypothetical protein